MKIYFALALFALSSAVFSHENCRLIPEAAKNINKIKAKDKALSACEKEKASCDISVEIHEGERLDLDDKIKNLKAYIHSLESLLKSKNIEFKAHASLSEVGQQSGGNDAK